MAKKKSSFYHVRWNRCGLNVERAAEVLGVTVDDVLSFDRDGHYLAERYLLLWDRKHVNLPGWDGWLFSRGVLRYKSQQWQPSSILASRDQSAEINRLNLHIETLSGGRGLCSALRLALRG
ncbi:hypothetical protein [Methylomonas fluvii]|uniref:Uncharacterized protein n=1 Tax=Methylomonas fluvii TaxID=1854564 RepID=A0ABR9DI54_9GAMM|nr:hypothetical protein [Methylomonas fluvii]MBD9362720.1 hypothetical protein [Methylomonas fluvii]